MPDLNYKQNKAREHIDKLNINNNNKQIIFDFIKYIGAEGLSKYRQIKYYYSLGKLAQMLKKEFSKANKQDIIELCSKINNSDFKEWTKHDYMAIIKRFYKWLREQEGMELDRRQYPPEVKWITIKVRKNKKILPKQLLTIDDIMILANNTNNLRDRALIFTLYESGARIGELLNLKIKDVDFDKYGAKLNLQGKTGSRKIRVVTCQPAISNWLLEHPRKEDIGSFLFCGIWGDNKGKELHYRHVNKLLKEAGGKAGILKPLNPHHFRHSRATYLAQRLTESELCIYMGWVMGSSEASTYVHLSGRDLDNKIKAMYGLIEEEKTEDTFKPIVCPRCKNNNDPASKFCSQCSLGLDAVTVEKYIETEKQLKASLQDEDTLEIIAQMVLDKIKKNSKD